MKAAASALLLTFILTSVILAPAGKAQDGQAPRYTLSPAGEGFLRLDSWTGAVTHCLVRHAHWVCESVADDRLALQEEIDRLSRENTALEKQVRIAAGESPPAGSVPPGTSRALPESIEEDLKSLRRYVEQLFRDLRDMAGRLSGSPEPRQL